MKKRRIAAAALIFAITLTGCSGTKPAESESKEVVSETNKKVESGTETTIGEVGDTEMKAKLSYVSWNDNQEDQLRATIDGFQEIYPNIEIDLQFTPWSEYWTKLEAAASAGTMPDIVTMHTIYAEKYANAQMIEPLDDLAAYNEKFSYDKLPQGVTRLYQFNNHTYGVAKDIDCVVLAYNKELFDKAGVSYPDETWTWEDMEKAAASITNKDNRVYGFAAYNNMQEAWGSFLYQNGGSIIDEENNVSGFDKAESVEAMKYFMNFLEQYSPTTAQLAETDRRAMFSSGNIGMIPVGNWQLNNFVSNDGIKDKFDIAPLPQGKDGKRATISNGLAYSVSSQSKNKEAAKLFAAYLGTEEANRRAAIGVSIPAYEGIVDVWAENHKEDYNTQIIVDSLKYGVQYVSTESRPLWEAAMNVHLEKLFNGEIGVEECFKQASLEMNEILAAE